MPIGEIVRQGATVSLLVTGWLAGSDNGVRWGREGHMVICEIAWQRLDASGRELVGELLGVATGAFPESCTWADAVRYSTHPYTRSYHFINVPAGSSGVNLTRDCGDATRRCVAWAVRHYAGVLQDRSESRRDRADALRFLGHFVGDLHQPLHAGRQADLGGNSIDVDLQFESACARRDLSLHTVWDSTFLCHAGVRWPEAATDLHERITDRQADAWSDFDVLGWTDESFRLAETVVYELPTTGEIDRAYYERAVRLSRMRLQRAGVRLAHLINAAAAGTLNFP